MTTSDTAAPRIDLAREPAFSLAKLEVVPSLRRVSGAHGSVVLEPRVMQVLVVLAQANGETVGRATLIARCWNGRVVGEHAINRVISRLRRFATEDWAGSIEIETIVKVGYRLTVPEPAPTAAVDVRPTPTRRRLLRAAIAVATTGVVVSGVAVWRTMPRDDRRALAAQLYRRGVEIRGELYDDDVQALAYFRRATEEWPGFAEAWGALALAHVALLEASPTSTHAAAADDARIAARRALVLDPRMADALVALALIDPPSRDWARTRADLGSLVDRFPRHPVPRAALGELFANVGAWSEALVMLRERAARELHARAQGNLAVALWAAGRADEAQATWREAARTWPMSATLWADHVHFHLFTGDYDRVTGLLDERSRPMASDQMLPPALILCCLKAFASQDTADRERAVEAVVVARRERKVWSLYAAWYLGALGRPELAFDLIDAYFFGPVDPANGTRSGLGRYERRAAWPLFAPPGRALRDDPRFADLMRRTGHEAFWRSTGLRPDFLPVG